LAFTKQYTQTDADNPVRGLYTDVKVDQAPADHNTYDKDFLFSLYSIGPFAHRPNDMVTFGYQYKWVSEWARLHTIIKSEITPIHNSSSLSLSYAMHLHRGVYWTNSLSYTNHPVFAPAHPGVLVLGSTVYLSF
jgi:porin